MCFFYFFLSPSEVGRKNVLINKGLKPWSVLRNIKLQNMHFDLFPVLYFKVFLFLFMRVVQWGWWRWRGMSNL